MEQLQAFADTPPAKARLIPLSVAGAFHTEHMAPAVGHLADARPVGLDPRPAHAVDLQPRRPGRPRRSRDHAADRRPDRRAGALGPLHGDDGRPRRHRDARDATGGHAHRHRQAGAPRRRDLRPQVTRPARRRARLLRQARRGVGHRHLPDLADGGLARPRAPSTATRRRTRRRPSSPVRRSATSPAPATGPRCAHRTAARSSSGSSRTATWCRPVNLSSDSTRWEQPDGRRSRPTRARRTPRSSASAATAPHA